jgi:hypothetical protein
MPILIGASILLVAVYFAINQSKAHNPSHVGTRGAGIGKSTSFQNVKAFPVGTVASSVASLGASLFGGAGTHNPVDPTIKPPGAMGDPMKGIVTSLDGPGPSNASVPAPSVVQTQIDGYSPNTEVTVPPTDATVTPADFSVDAYPPVAT